MITSASQRPGWVAKASSDCDVAMHAEFSDASSSTGGAISCDIMGWAQKCQGSQYVLQTM